MKSLVALFAVVLIGVVSCASSPSAEAPAATTSSTQATATSSSTKTTSTSSTPTTSTSATAEPSEEGAALILLCAKHCEALKAVQDLPACASPSACSEQVSIASKAVTAFSADLKAAGLDYTDYPNLHQSATSFLDNAQEYLDDPECATFKADGSAEGMTCVMTWLAAKTNVGTMELDLRIAIQNAT